MIVLTFYVAMGAMIFILNPYLALLVYLNFHPPEASCVSLL